MYKVRDIADGMILWKGDTVIGVKGMTLSNVFDDCDCYKLPGNPFDYALAPNNKYTEEQQKEIDRQTIAWNEDDEDDYQEPTEAFEKTEAPSTLNGDAFFDNDDLPFQNMFSNGVPYCNRQTRRKVERYMKKHPSLTFTQAYNKIYKTKYSEPYKGLDTTVYDNNKPYDDTTTF